MSLLKNLRINFLRKGIDSLEDIPVVQGDTGRVLVFTPTDYMIPDGATAKIYVKKPDNTQIYNNCTIKDGKVNVAITEQMIAVVGREPYQVEIVDKDGIVTSFSGWLNVQARLKSADAIMSTNEFDVLTKTLTDMSAATAASKAATDVINKALPGVTAATKQATDAADKANAIKAPTVKIGTVTTLTPEQQATITNSGTDTAAVLDIGLPQGPAGSIDNMEGGIASFTEATERANIDTADNVGTIFGKIKKWFTDLKAFVFNNLATDATSTSTEQALAATVGKTLADKDAELQKAINAANSSIKKLNESLGMCKIIDTMYVPSYTFSLPLGKYAQITTTGGIYSAASNSDTIVIATYVTSEKEYAKITFDNAKRTVTVSNKTSADDNIRALITLPR